MMFYSVQSCTAGVLLQQLPLWHSKTSDVWRATHLPVPIMQYFYHGVLQTKVGWPAAH